MSKEQRNKVNMVEFFANILSFLGLRYWHSDELEYDEAASLMMTIMITVSCASLLVVVDESALLYADECACDFRGAFLVFIPLRESHNAILKSL